MHPLRPLAIRIGRLSWLPRFLPQIVAIDMFIQRISRGRLSLLSLVGLPELTLRVKGRRSGIVRETPLLFVPHADGPLIAGSNWGAPKPPMWVANLGAAETATIQIHGRTYTIRPRELTGEERARAWQHMLGTWPNYQKYAERTDRTIRVFQLVSVES